MKGGQPWEWLHLPTSIRGLARPAFEFIGRFQSSSSSISSGTLTLDGTQGLLLSIQNNTVIRNVRAQAPPRLALVPGVGM